VCTPPSPPSTFSLLVLGLFRKSNRPTDPPEWEGGPFGLFEKSNRPFRRGGLELGLFLEKVPRCQHCASERRG
jgi:hypothetical protein